MKQNINFIEIEKLFIERDKPIWRPISSRELAKILGVSLQSLANWRVRESGPEPEPYRKGKGNRTFYRPDKLLSWLDDGKTEPWEYCRKWLLKRDMDLLGGMDREGTAWFIKELDPHI